MTPNSIDMLMQKLDSIQSNLSAAMKSVNDLEVKSAQLRKQVEVVKGENTKARELLQKLSKVRL